MTQSKSTKSIALLNSKAPYANSAGKEALDIALIFGSFEQKTALFFQGDGVYQLVSGQDGTLIAVKDYLKTFAALPFYDIEDVYVCQQSLIERGLTNHFHIDDVQVLNLQDFSDKLTEYNTLLRF